MNRPTMTVAEAKQQLDAMVARKIERRRALVEAAVAAAVPQAAGIIAQLEAGQRPWWPALAPLTTGERAGVYRAMAAGAAGSSSDVD